MNNTLNKIHQMSSFNVMARGHIIAGADLHPHPENEADYVLEIVPFIEEIEKAGIGLQPEAAWDDYFDSEEEGHELNGEERIYALLKTILKTLTYSISEITVKKRKNVYDLTITKNDIERSLRMIIEYERFVNSDSSFTPALYVHDLDEYDIWRFDTDTTDEEIYRTVYPALKAVNKRHLKH